MKFGPLDVPALPALSMPRLPLSAFRRRLVFRGVFVLLSLATVALAVALLAEEKRRSRQIYEDGFRQRLATLVAQLRHPAGQLALLNAAHAGSDGQPLAPMILPYSALDFDDPYKARQAVEMSGCATRWLDGAQLCVAVGGSAYAGGFIYLVLAADLPPARARERGQLDLRGVNRARLDVQVRGIAEQWIAPFEAPADSPVASRTGGLRGRLTGFASGDADLLSATARPDRDFRGWLWQSAQCRGQPSGVPPCRERTLLSIRVPVEAYREALFGARPPVWPPHDLHQVRLRLRWLGDGDTPAFDSDAPGAAAPLGLADVAASLAPGETLTIRRQGGSAADFWRFRGRSQEEAYASHWLTQLVASLPADSANRAVEAQDDVVAADSRYEVRLAGDLQGVDRSLGITAARLSWFVAAMLAAIGLAWLVIELGLIRRVALLTRRAAALSYNMQDPELERRLGDLDVTDLRGSDELGILAGSLAELLERVKDGVRREHIRAEQERDMWHAVGHEIVSPLQSLMVLHGDDRDPSHRYVKRMLQAVRVLYGTASPSEAIQSATLHLSGFDLDRFLRTVADNAHFAGIAEVRYEAKGRAVPVRADEYFLEDVITHVLRNADRFRNPGSPITLTLAEDDASLVVGIENAGPAIDEAMLERIFDYGTTAASSADDTERRGQGLFVARTYMAKMGGTIEARNVVGGVRFVLQFPRVRA